MTTDEFGVVGFSFVVRVDLAGYVGDLTLTSESCADLVRMVKTLRSAGIEQPAPVVTVPATPTPVAQDTANAVPQCPIHNRPLKPSKAPGQWFCSAQLDDGSGYCKHKHRG